jgi:hypothetical protein
MDGPRKSASKCVFVLAKRAGICSFTFPHDARDSTAAGAWPAQYAVDTNTSPACLFPEIDLPPGSRANLAPAGFASKLGL